MSTITQFSQIPERSDATPGLFNARFQQLHDNTVSVNSELSLSNISLPGWNRGSISTTVDFSNGTLSTNTIRPASGNTITIPPTFGMVLHSIQSGGGIYDVRAFGAKLDGSTDDADAYQSAISHAQLAHGTVVIPSSASGSKISTGLRITAPVTILIGDSCITGPTTKDTFLFTVRSHYVAILMHPNTKLANSSVSGGGLVKWIDSDSFRMEGGRLFLNSKPASKAMHHLGGWYTHVSNVWTDKNTELNGASGSTTTTSLGLLVESTAAGDGSRGVYVATYQNVTVNRVTMVGAGANTVTTLLFERLDTSYVVCTLGRAVTMIQPIVQKTTSVNGNAHFEITDTAGFTAKGGDFEGSGSIWSFSGSNSLIHSEGNLAGLGGGFSGTYISGTLPDRSFFFDKDLSCPVITGAPAIFELQSSGWVERHRMGAHYSGDLQQLGVNIKASSSTQGALDNTGNAGILASYGITYFQLDSASAGANPRTLSRMMRVDASAFVTDQPLVVPAGSVIAPGSAFSSDASLGWYRSGASTIAQSFGTFNLATNAVRLSMRTLAASSVTASAAKTNVAVDEVVFTIGGASGASLIIMSGGTAYGFNSAFSAKQT